MDKRYVIVAGVNGFGKTTLYNIYPEMRLACRVNPDEICKQMGGDWRDPVANLQAGKAALRLLDDALACGKPVNQETTLAGHGVVNRIVKAKEAGYRIEMHYVGVDSVEIAKARIRHRVAIGGHGIPDADVERRYARSLENVKKIVSKVDELFFYDNSTERGIKEIARCKHGSIVWCVTHSPQWFVCVKAAIEKAHGREEECHCKSPADKAMDKLFPNANDAKKEKANAKANDKPHGVSR